jgi:hypothetical protein
VQRKFSPKYLNGKHYVGCPGVDGRIMKEIGRGCVYCVCPGAVIGLHENSCDSLGFLKC